MTYKTNTNYSGQKVKSLNFYNRLQSQKIFRHLNDGCLAVPAIRQRIDCLCLENTNIATLQNTSEMSYEKYTIVVEFLVTSNI